VDQPRRHGGAEEAEHRSAANRAVGVSALGLALTGGIELALALVTGSVGLLGDALHNLSDVSTSAVVFLGFWVSKKPPTERYPYGYERAEDLAGLGVALVIWLSAVFAGVASYRKLIHHGGTTHLGVGMAGAVLGIVGNQLVARYKARIGGRIHSATLLADAKHSWLDALSSVGALAGLIAVAAGYWWADPIAGFAVTLFILHVGYEVTTEIAHHLLDGVEPEHLHAAKAVAETVPGVRSAVVRGRWTGRSLVLDIDGELDSGTALRDADVIGAHVTDAVHDAVEEARTVHWAAHPATSATVNPAAIATGSASRGRTTDGGPPLLAPQQMRGGQGKSSRVRRSVDTQSAPSSSTTGASTTR
jgi:cation diffusion facilitator family transporter